LHATDELVTEFAVEPYSSIAPIHVVGLITPSAKYGVYSHWQPGTMAPSSFGEDTELYDYSTQGGRLELDNRAGRSRLEPGLRAQLDRAITDELRAPLPKALAAAQREGFADYFHSAGRAERTSNANRRRELEQIVGADLGEAVGSAHRRHHPRPLLP
jgi:hypothetical protein